MLKRIPDIIPSKYRKVTYRSFAIFFNFFPAIFGALESVSGSCLGFTQLARQQALQPQGSREAAVKEAKEMGGGI